MRRVKSLMSADTSDQLIRLGVGQKVKPRARTDDSSLESGVCDRLMTEVLSSLMVVRVLRGLRLRRLRVRVEACVLLLRNVLRLSLTVTLVLVACEILVFLARLRASSDSRDKAIELILLI